MTTLVIPPHAGKTVKAARVRLGSYEFEKKGVSRFDLRDPYRLAVGLTWPQFLAALLALYLAVNVSSSPPSFGWFPDRWRMLGRTASRTPKFYEWLAASDSSKVPQGPPIWICGGCHIGNLGP